jgi:integrase
LPESAYEDENVSHTEDVRELVVGRRRRVFTIDHRAIAAGVHEQYLGCPFIMTGTGCPEQVNLHLQEIWIGKWPEFDVPEDRSSSAYIGRKKYRAMPGSVRETANKLSNLVSWCAESNLHGGKQLNCLALTENDVDGYATDMERGCWSVDISGRPLSAGTIAGRQVAAIGLALWAKSRGYTTEARFRISEHRHKTIGTGGAMQIDTKRRYAVVRRQNPNSVSVPSLLEVAAAIMATPDVAVQLGSKLAYHAGLRAHEICALTEDDAFSPKNRKVNGTHFISVLGKGRKRRAVEIDDDLLKELADFRDFERRVRLHRHNEKSNVLLIRDTNGKPFNYRSFWRLFKKTHAVSPHIARHFYAVHYLLRDWERQQLIASKKGRMLSPDAVTTLLSTALIMLKENLGHAWLSTTEKYLVLLRHFIDHADVSLTFQDRLDNAGRMQQLRSIS